MKVDKTELLFADEFIKAHFARIVDWSIGDIKRCCRMKDDGTCDDGGALVGAFILWTCAIDYFGGILTGYTSQGATKARYKAFIEKYMPRYEYEKIIDLRWSLAHYYSPHHFVLYHENNMESNKDIHLSTTTRGIMLHLGTSIQDLSDAVDAYCKDLETDKGLKIKLWRYFKEQLPIMPVEVERVIAPSTLASLATGTAIQTINASGTVSEKEWFNK